MGVDGRFMVAVRAIIQHVPTKQVLILKNTKGHKMEWTMVSGRMKQFEEIDEALKREIGEETGITDVVVEKLLSVWHGFRGRKSAENELISVTFLCLTNTQEVVVSGEHAGFIWVKTSKLLDYLPAKFFSSKEHKALSK